MFTPMFSLYAYVDAHVYTTLYLCLHLNLHYIIYQTTYGLHSILFPKPQKKEVDDKKEVDNKKGGEIMF